VRFTTSRREWRSMDRVGVYRWVEAKFYPWGDAFADGIAKCCRC